MKNDDAMKRALLIWGVVTSAFAAYYGAAVIASRASITSIALTPGEAVDVRAFRIFKDKLRFQLAFKTDGVHQRPELGHWEEYGDWRQTGFLQLTPGAEVRISVGSGDEGPVVFEAMPTGSYAKNANFRDMTANLSVASGKWRWFPPADTPEIILSPGFNRLTFDVASVGSPLVGETVQLIIQPALGLKACYGVACYLRFAFLWPLFVPIPAAWAGILIICQTIGRRALKEG